MKHYIAYLSAVLLLVVFTACTNTLAPAPQSNTVNYSTNNVNTTTTFSNVGIGAAWIYYACQSGQTCLTTINISTSTTVTACFSSPPTAGAYQLVSSTSQLAPGKAVLTVTNPPGQTLGSVWYSASGTVNVFNWSIPNPANITASFANIPCLDSPGSLDSVIVSGQVVCL